MKKNTYMTGSANPAQPRALHIDAAAFLATVARRYTNENANAREVLEAFEGWKLAYHKSLQTVPCDHRCGMPAKCAELGCAGAAGRLDA